MYACMNEYTKWKWGYLESYIVSENYDQILRNGASTISNNNELLLHAIRNYKFDHAVGVEQVGICIYIYIYTTRKIIGR